MFPEVIKTDFNPTEYPSQTGNSLGKSYATEPGEVHLRPQDNRVVGLANAKIRQVNDALSGSDPKGRLMVLTDLANSGYSTMQTISSFSPTIAKISGVAWGSFIGGEVIGTINLINAFVSLHEGLKDCGDSLQKGKLYADFFFQLAISILMIMASLAFKVSFLGTFAAVVTANPAILALLFLIPLLPTLGDVCIRHVRMNAHDLLAVSGPITLENLTAAFAAFENNPGAKLRAIELDWGDECAKAFMELWKAVKEKNSKEEQLQHLHAAILKEQMRWKEAQKWKLAEVLSMVIATAFGLGGLGGYKKIMNGMSSLVTAVGNLIPVKPDAAMKLMRNTPYLLEPLKMATQEPQ